MAEGGSPGLLPGGWATASGMTVARAAEASITAARDMERAMVAKFVALEECMRRNKQTTKMGMLLP